MWVDVCEEETANFSTRFLMWWLRLLDSLPVINMFFWVFHFFKSERIKVYRSFAWSILFFIPFFNIWRLFVSFFRVTKSHLKNYRRVKTCSESLFLDSWMGHPSILKRPLSQLVLPGAHNAGSAHCTSSPKLRAVGAFSECQNLSIFNQLRSGTRVLDLRLIDLCTHNDSVNEVISQLRQTQNDSDVLTSKVHRTLKQRVLGHPSTSVICSDGRFWVCHLAYIRSLRSIAQEINEFFNLPNTETEIVILAIKGDWPHRVDSLEQHKEILQVFKDEFQSVQIADTSAFFKHYEPQKGIELNVVNPSLNHCSVDHLTEGGQKGKVLILLPGVCPPNVRNNPDLNLIQQNLGKDETYRSFLNYDWVLDSSWSDTNSISNAGLFDNIRRYLKTPISKITDNTTVETALLEVGSLKEEEMKENISSDEIEPRHIFSILDCHITLDITPITDVFLTCFLRKEKVGIYVDLLQAAQNTHLWMARALSPCLYDQWKKSFHRTGSSRINDDGTEEDDEIFRNVWGLLSPYSLKVRQILKPYETERMKTDSNENGHFVNVIQYDFVRFDINTLIISQNFIMDKNESRANFWSFLESRNQRISPDHVLFKSMQRSALGSRDFLF